MDQRGCSGVDRRKGARRWRSCAAPRDEVERHGEGVEVAGAPEPVAVMGGRRWPRQWQRRVDERRIWRREEAERARGVTSEWGMGSRGALIPSRRRRGSAGRCARSDGDERERPGRLYRERRRRTELGGLAGWEWAEAQEEPWGCDLFFICFVFFL